MSRVRRLARGVTAFAGLAALATGCALLASLDDHEGGDRPGADGASGDDGAAREGAAGDDARTGDDGGSPGDGAASPAEVLVPGPSAVVALALVGDQLVWTNDDVAVRTVESAHVDGGRVFTITSPTQAVGSVAVDATHVYWQTNADVRVAQLDGGGATTLANVGGNGAMGADDARVCWTASPYIDCCPANATSCTPTQIFENGALTAYVFAPGSLMYVGSSYGVLQCPAATSACSTLSSASNPRYLALVGANLYISGTRLQGNGDEVWVVDVADGGAQSIVTGLTNAGGVTSDGTTVYYVDHDTSGVPSIYRVSVATGAHDKIATGQFGAKQLVEDSTSVYWAGRGPDGGGAIMRLRK